MADDTNTAEREAFEAHYRRCGAIDETLSRWVDDGSTPPAMVGKYIIRSVQDAWLAFQAGRASLAASAGREPVAAAAQSALETLERTHKSLARQLDLIAERAPGNFLDKRPVVSTLIMHQKRTEAAAAALRTALESHPSPPEGMAGWKPITDAPKDGTEFLAVYGRQGNVQQIARWNTWHGHWESKGNWLPGFESNVTAIHQLPAPPLPASEAKEL